MKTTRSIFCILVLTAVMTACRKDDSKSLEAQAPVIADLAETSFTLSDVQVNNYLFRLYWSKAKFFSSGKPSHVEEVMYQIEASLADDDFANPYAVASTAGLYLDIYHQTLRDVYDALVGVANQEIVNVAFRVKTTGGGMTFYSASVILTIIPFEPEPELTDIAESTLSAEASVYTLGWQGDNNPIAFTVMWDATLFYFDHLATPMPMSPLTYTLQMDMTGNGFQPVSTQTLASGLTSLSADLYNNTLNSILVDTYSATPNNAFNIDLRLVINYGEGDKAGIAYSNTLTLTIIPFAPFYMLQPIYIFGNMNSWNNSDPSGMWPMFKNGSTVDDPIYTFTGYFPAGCNYKFIPSEALGTWRVFSINGDNTFEYAVSEGGAIVNETAGFKTVTINVQTMNYSVTDYNASSAPVWNTVGIIGGFSGWSPPVLPMTVFPEGNIHLWVLEYGFPTLTMGWGDPFKFVAEETFDHQWVALNDFDMPFGNTVYFTGTQPDFSVTIRQAGTYRIWFNDLTGHYAAFRIGN